MLAKEIDPRDYMLAIELGVDIPNKKAVYTVLRGPFLEIHRESGRGTLAVELEEIPGCNFDTSFFVEVQPPMKIDLNKILVT